MKNILLLVFLAFSSSIVYSQDCEIPANVKLVDKEDYAPYHNLVVECVGWLESTPIKKEPRKRDQVNAFLIKWMTGTPTLSISYTMYHSEVISVDTKNLMVPFLGGWSRAIILSDFNLEKYEGMAEGIRTVLGVMELPGAPRKSREIKRLIKADKKGVLIEYLKKKDKG